MLSPVPGLQRASVAYPGPAHGTSPRAYPSSEAAAGIPDSWLDRQVSSRRQSIATSVNSLRRPTPAPADPGAHRLSQDAPVEEDFVHEVLAMNTLAMEQCKAEALEEALRLLSEIYMRLNGEEGGVLKDAQRLEHLKSMTLNNMGVVECHRGQHRQALSHFEGARQLEENWNMASPSVALNSCAAYNSLKMYDKATAAALETIDMLRSLEIQRQRQRRLDRTREEGGPPPPRCRSVGLAEGSAMQCTAEEAELLAVAGRPQVADSDNRSLWGAAWHNLAVAQINSARGSKDLSEHTNALVIFQNAMRATGDLLGMKHPMTRAIIETYRAVRKFLRRHGAYKQHRSLLTAPLPSIDPREQELEELSVEPVKGHTRHGTIELQKNHLTITFRGEVTEGEKLTERVERAAYPNAPAEPYRRGHHSQKKGKSKWRRTIPSTLRRMPLSDTLLMASELYGNPHPLLYTVPPGMQYVEDTVYESTASHDARVARGALSAPSKSGKQGLPHPSGHAAEDTSSRRFPHSGWVVESPEETVLGHGPHAQEDHAAASARPKGTRGGRLQQVRQKSRQVSQGQLQQRQRQERHERHLQRQPPEPPRTGPPGPRLTGSLPPRLPPVHGGPEGSGHPPLPTPGLGPFPGMAPRPLDHASPDALRHHDLHTNWSAALPGGGEQGRSAASLYAMGRGDPTHALLPNGPSLAYASSFEQSKALLLAQPPPMTTSVHTTYFPVAMGDQTEAPAVIDTVSGVAGRPSGEAVHSLPPASLPETPPVVAGFGDLQGGSAPATEQLVPDAMSGAARGGGRSVSEVSTQTMGEPGTHRDHTPEETGPNEFFDAMWVAADDQSIRHGNRLFGRPGYYLTTVMDVNEDGVMSSEVAPREVLPLLVYSSSDSSSANTNKYHMGSTGEVPNLAETQRTVLPNGSA